MSNELMKIDNRPLSLDDVMRIGKEMTESTYFDVKLNSQSVVKIWAGQEIGIPAGASMRGIDFIDGKISISSGIMASLIKTHPRTDYRVREHTNTICKIECFENGISVGFSEFTIEDAELAGLTGPKSPAWKKYPRNMLIARAISNAVRWFFPFLTSGQAYTPEELDGDYDFEPDFIIETPEVEPEYTIQPAIDFSSLETLVRTLHGTPVEKLKHINEAIENGDLAHSEAVTIPIIVAIESEQNPLV